MTEFESYIARKQAEYGSKFDKSTLAPQFVQFFNTGQRVEVSFCDSKGQAYETKRGRVGVTTGWKPVFILLLTSRSTGSSYTLGRNDRVTKVIERR